MSVHFDGRGAVAYLESMSIRTLARVAFALGFAGFMALFTAPAARADDLPTTPTVRLTAVDIDLRLRPALGTLEQDVRLELEGDGATWVDLRLHPGLVVERCESSVGTADYRQSGEQLRVIFDSPLDGGVEVRLRITGHPRDGSDDRIEPRWVALDPDLDWYPRLDGAFHTAVVRVRIDDGWTVAAPGEGRREDDGRWVFRPEGRVRELAVVAAPGLGTAATEIVRSPLRVVAPDAAGSAAAMKVLFADPFAWFSGALAPYPFDGLTVALVPGLPERVEASGFIAVPADAPPRSASDAASMLSGQWHGQWIDADGPWIRAFAAWHAAAYARDRNLPPPADIALARVGYFRLDPQRDIAIEDATRRTPDAVLRGKGAAATEMIRTLIGPRRFLRVLDGLVALAPGHVTYSDLRALIRAEAGPEGVRALDDWFGRAGVPRLRVTLRVMDAAGGGYRADLRIEQKSGDYAIPIDVVLIGAGEQRRETISIVEATTDLYYLIDFRPRRIEVDPLGRLFARPAEIVVP